MGVFDYLKNIISGKKAAPARYQNGAPVLESFGRNVYLSDFVNNAIDRIASEIAKINVKSVVENSKRVTVQNDDITRLFLAKPNPLQTAGDFLSNVEWLRRKNGNAFIYPQYETGRAAGGGFRRYIALYPLRPVQIYIGARDGAAWEIRLEFSDGSAYTLPYSDLIHLRWRRGVNTVIGGGDDGGATSDYSLVRTVDALDKTIQGLPKSIEAGLQVKGVYTAKTLADAKKLGEIRDKFEDHIKQSKTGIIATDFAGEFKPVNVGAADIHPEAMKFLKAVIEERFGVSAAILSGDYNGEQHSAFYQASIEEFIAQFEQAASAALFSPRELGAGHRIKCYYSKVSYMSASDKMALAGLAKETGIMTLNQINEMFGIEPFAEGDRRLQSLNYVNIEDVDAYQKGKAGLSSAEGGGDEGE